MFVFLTFGKMNLHMKRRRKQMRVKYALSVRFAMFVSKRILNRDVTAKGRAGDKPYECSVCNNRFCTNSELASHSEKPFRCSVCTARFNVFI